MCHVLPITLCKMFAGKETERNDHVQSFIAMQNYCLPMNFFPHGSDELFVGRAGYLAACLVMKRRFQTSVIPVEVTSPLCDVIIESGRQYSKNHNHPSPLMFAYYNSEYLGMLFPSHYSCQTNLCTLFNRQLQLYALQDVVVCVSVLNKAVHIIFSAGGQSGQQILLPLPFISPIYKCVLSD